MQGVRLNRPELIQTYGVSQRLAVRVGALLAHKVDVTPAVLEMAVRASPIEKMLLHSDLLASADDLDTRRLEAIARETGAGDQGPFVVARGAEWRTIALAEEQMSEAGWEEAATEPAGSTALATMTQPGVPLRPDEVRRVFSAEDIARLKLQALTGAESETRVSALRQIRLAPLTPQEKGSIFLRVLLDPVSPARSEAIKGLEDMGFDRDTAEAVQDMLEQQGRARRAAIERVGALLSRLAPMEQQIALRVLVEGLREFEDAEAQEHLLRVLGEASEAIAGMRDITEETVRLGLRKVVDAPARLAGRVTEFLYRLAARRPQGMADLLWHEIESLRDPPTRALALRLLVQLDLPPEQRAALADVMVNDLLHGGLEELERQKVGHNLVSLGEPALSPILACLAAAGVQERLVLIPLLDMLVVDRPVGAEVRNRAARHLLECLRLGERRVREAVYRTRVFGLPELQPRLRMEISRTLIEQLPRTKHPDLIERMGDMIESLGEAAVDPLAEALRESSSPHAVDLMARLLGRTAAAALRAGGQVPRASSLLRFLRKRVADPGVRQGGCALALGMLAAVGIEPADEAQRDADLLLARLRAASFQTDILQALGWLGACEFIDLTRRVRISQAFSSVLKSTESHEVSDMRELDTPDGRLYEFAGQVAFDSEALPVVVEAMERMFLSPHVTDALKQQIVSQLTHVWEKVAAWQVIWGPRSSESLALTLGRIGAEPRTPAETCLSIARAMSRQINRLSVVRAIGALFTSPLDDEEFNNLSVECGRDILGRWDQPETSAEERRIVLETVARIAARPQIRSRSRFARDLRRRTIALLFNAFNEAAEWARRPLEWLRDCASLPLNQRQAIAERLRRASALVKVE